MAAATPELSRRPRHGLTLPEELRMLRETLARFVREELIPLKPIVIRHEAERGLTDTPLIPPEAEKKLTGKAKEIGLYGIDVPILKARPLPRLHKQSRRHRNSVATFAMEPS